MRFVSSVLVFLCSTTLLIASVSQPRVFVENRGQWNSKVLFAAPAAGGMVWITTSGMVLSQETTMQGENVRHTVALDVINATTTSVIEAERNATTPPVYLSGGLSTQQSLSVSKVVARNVRPGIHLEYVWDGDNVRYNVLVDKGASLPNDLFSVKGASRIDATTDGFVCTTPLGTISMGGTVAYVDATGKRLPVTTLSKEATIGFAVADRQGSQAIVVDPVIKVFTINGSATDEVTSVVRDREGNVVLGGWTSSLNLEVPDGGAFGTRKANRDGFVACVTPDLSRILAWTYITGDSNEAVRGVALGPNGDVWVTGESNSLNIAPADLMTSQPTGTVDGYVLRFSNDLSICRGGVWLPGNREDLPKAIAVDAEGVVAVCGQTTSTSGIVSAPGYDRTHNGDWDGFVVMIDQLGRLLTQSTYMGSRANDAFTTITFDRGGGIVVGGWTANNNFPTWPEKILVWIPDPNDYYYGGRYEEQGTNPYDITYNGGNSDVVCVKFNNELQLIFSTYFGGSGDDIASTVLVDNENRVQLVGTTTSADLPVLPALSTERSGGIDVFSVGLSPDGLRLRNCMYYGGSADDIATGAIFDANGGVVVVGSTKSVDLPSVGAGSSIGNASLVDGFIAILQGSETRISTTFGWDGDDVPIGVLSNEIGDLFVVGNTTSTFASVGGGDQTQASDIGIFLLKYAFGDITLRNVTNPTICAGARVNLAWIADGVLSPTMYNIEYSADGGATWDTVVSNLATTSYSWIVPANVATSRRGVLRVVSSRGHTDATEVPLVVDATPIIVKQPESKVACVGSRVELEAEISSNTATYVWNKNGQPVQGATSTKLTIESAGAESAGDYTLVATSSCGAVTTSTASLNLIERPEFSAQPQSATVNPGATLVLTISAIGPNLTYQWEFNETAIDGATSATLTITNVTAAQSGRYRCVVASDCGSATSEIAQIGVGPVSVSSTDVDQSINVFPNPAQTTFTVSFQGEPVPLSSIRVIDVTGRVVFQTSNLGTLTQSSVVVPVTHLANGTYTIALVRNGNTIMKNIVIQR